MAIITVSRGSASGGILLAEGLARELDYDVVSREDIVHEAAGFGAPEEKLLDALLKPPSFWERFKHERRRYLTFVRAVLCERVQGDRVVYHGNAGHLLLCGISHVLCLRLIAPLSYRIRTLMERERLDSEGARRRIDEIDRQRREWTSFLYGADWLDPSLYDITINLQTLDVSGAVELAATAARRPEFATTEESARAMADLVLASRVEAALAANAETAPIELEVSAADGVVSLRGRLRSASMVAAAVNVAGGVTGVRSVNREALDAPDYTV
ncbi:MAG: cytidylate kinase family protein [Candidatus Eiseniibacteriota bacterium]|jgi:cytidylate kinase